MTFVLLVAGIDLSVGANMYASCIIVALYMKGWNPVFGFLVAGTLGLAFGACNAFIITRLRVPAFIATLATLFIGRAIALYFSGVKMIPFGKELTRLGRSDMLGIPAAIWIFLLVFLLAWVTLRLTTFGRQVYAVGADPEAAAKAGIDVPRILFAVYCICGVTAGIGGLVSASQVAAASSTFGFQKEFPVIAAAVLGGTSLFGGRGGVVGTVFGAVLIQTVENGLVMTNADPYVYPLIISVIIFIAVLVELGPHGHPRPARATQDTRGGDMTGRLRGTVIGCGFFAENHLNAWASIPDVELVAVCDIDPAKAASAAQRFGAGRHYTDAATMLREQKPDFVDIATTVASHRALVELAAAEKIPAIVQKPFGPTMADCEAMVAACAAAGVPLMVHENFRFQPPLRASARADRPRA